MFFSKVSRSAWGSGKLVLFAVTGGVVAIGAPSAVAGIGGLPAGALTSADALSVAPSSAADVGADSPGVSAGDFDGSLSLCARVELTADSVDGDPSVPPESVGSDVEGSPGGFLSSAAASFELGEAVTWAQI